MLIGLRVMGELSTVQFGEEKVHLQLLFILLQTIYYKQPTATALQMNHVDQGGLPEFSRYIMIKYLDLEQLRDCLAFLLKVLACQGEERIQCI